MNHEWTTSVFNKILKPIVGIPVQWSCTRCGIETMSVSMPEQRAERVMVEFKKNLRRVDPELADCNIVLSQIILEE